MKLDEISVCDPYAGVGPALVPPTKLPEIVDEIYASDLNPHAAELLLELTQSAY